MEPQIDVEVTEPAPRRRSFEGIRSYWIIVVAIFVGIMIGRAIPGLSTVTAADSGAEATATRAAELQELDELRTKVAQPVVCSPVPTATPTNTPTPEPTPTTVPAQPAGTELIDASGLGVTVLSIQAVNTPDGAQATGQLVRLNVSLSNTTDTPKKIPFVDWRLVDAAGNRYSVDLDATAGVVGAGWALAIGAHEKVERAVVFDVAPDAGTTFILENENDPTFRIEVSIESRG